MKKTWKKCIVLAIIFILTFVNYGFSIEVIATEGSSVFSSGIFKKNSIELKAYFDNNDEIMRISLPFYWNYPQLSLHRRMFHARNWPGHILLFGYTIPWYCN